MAHVDENAFSYANPADPLWKRACIGAVEVATGRNRLKKLYFEKQGEDWGGQGFFETAIAALSIDLRYDAKALAAIPKAGPLVVVSNHPFGVLDGIVMCALMNRSRPDFRVLTNAVLLRAPEMREKMLPVDFSETVAARRANAASRSAALSHVSGGGCLVIFPAGAISTSPDWFGRAPAVDGPWTPYAARLVMAGKCPVVPLFFRGQNSRLFQIVSHIHPKIRLALFFHELRRRIGTALEVEIGETIAWEELAAIKDRAALTSVLRSRTLQLGYPRPR